jgi:hypothetical protein
MRAAKAANSLLNVVADPLNPETLNAGGVPWPLT